MTKAPENCVVAMALHAAGMIREKQKAVPQSYKDTKLPLHEVPVSLSHTGLPRSYSRIQG